jgi:ankyrin repeat protein
LGQQVSITDEMMAAAKNYNGNYGHARTNFLEEVLEKLKNNQPININAQDPYGVNGHPPSGETALHRAVQVSHEGIVKALLSRKADVNQADNLGYMPLIMQHLVQVRM